MSNKINLTWNSTRNFPINQAFRMSYKVSNYQPSQSPPPLCHTRFVCLGGGGGGRISQYTPIEGGFYLIFSYLKTIFPSPL